MKKSIRNMVIISTAALSICGAFPALAADAIEDIELNIISYIKEGDTTSNVRVQSLSNEYEVSDYEVTNAPDDDDEWEEGDNPKLKITLKADGDDYKFTSSLSKSDVTIKGNDATVTKVSRSSNTKFYVYVTLDDVEEASSSTVQPPYNQGQPAANNQPANNGGQSGWIQENGRWKWNNQGNGYIQNQWQQIDNKWYYFDNNGYMATGWQFIDGKWYYLNEDGEMLHDTYTPDGYWVGSDGVWNQ